MTPVIYNPYWNSQTWYTPPWHGYSPLLPAPVWGSSWNRRQIMWNRLIYR